MFITKEWVKEKDACAEGYRYFIEHFPEGAEYQDILDTLAQENRADWASWLLQKAGPVDTVLEVEELTAEASLFFAGRIVIKGAIKVARWLLAGEGIEAGGGIEAGWGIEAGGGIKAGDGIEAGGGIKAGKGIKAGGGIKAGDEIEAGEGIEAGWGIEAGDGIKAGDGIEAGEDYGIYVGLRLRISLKAKYAVVVAKEEPKNLLLGTFKSINEDSKK